MKFWGWGDERAAGDGRALPPHADAVLAEALSLGPVPARPARVAAVEDVRLPDSALAARARADLDAAVGRANVRDDHAARVLHAAGKGYADLVRMRAGDGSGAPDAVVLPGSHDEVRAVLGACARHGVAVVPFGGGTSVVGGVEPLRGGFPAVISLDLGRMRRPLDLDERSLTAAVPPGIPLPALEAHLGQRGLTLGHFPQSFEFATAGGCVATRSAGQASTGYGRIDALVRGVRLAAPAGDLALKAMPASGAGPDLRQAVVGSEGVLGVITRADLRVAPAPQERRYEGFAFASFAGGVEALRALAQAGEAPDVARLSDEEETRLHLALAGGGVRARLEALLLRARGVGGGCLAVCGWEGGREDVARRRARSAALLRAHGAAGLGAAPGRAWVRGRYDAPYLRDDLLDRGVLVETLETATQWSQLGRLHRAVGAALRAALTPALVACHVSHLYPTGASLYVTLLTAAEQGQELDRWRAAKTAASEAILAHGGTITHHHAVGRDHAGYLEAEVGTAGVGALRALKDELDPEGIMNPGKLLPDARS